jgi:transposase
VCFNPEEAKRQAKHRHQVVTEIEAELARHKSRWATAKWAVVLLASGRYGRYVKVAGGEIEIDREAIRKAERMDGKWVLTTNDDTLGLEDVATGYKSMMVIERCFRMLKRTRISMSPMYHWLPRRIEAHVKMCVLALLLERVAELATGMPWPRILEALNRIQVTEYRSETHQFFQRNELPDEAVAILKKLDISPPRPVLDIQRTA